MKTKVRYTWGDTTDSESRPIIPLLFFGLKGVAGVGEAGLLDSCCSIKEAWLFKEKCLSFIVTDIGTGR